jgi:hypothetical protein
MKLEELEDAGVGLLSPKSDPLFRWEIGVEEAVSGPRSDTDGVSFDSDTLEFTG